MTIPQSFQDQCRQRALAALILQYLLLFTGLLPAVEPRLPSGTNVVPLSQEAMEPAFDRVKRMLFRPFNLGKWFTIGFCAWLVSGSAAVPGCGLEHRPGACFSTGGGTPPEPAGGDACTTH